MRKMAACYSDLSKTGVYIFPDRLQKNYKQYLSYKTDTQNWSVTSGGLMFFLSESLIKTTD